MRAVWKYNLKITESQHVVMPIDAMLLSVQFQRGFLTLWALVDDERPNERREFLIFGTGHPINHSAKMLTYVGTAQQDGLVWHVFRDVL